MQTYKFEFGVYKKGKPLWIINTATCTHFQARIIVGILNLASESLLEGTYFACDYTHL